MVALPLGVNVLTTFSLH